LHATIAHETTALNKHYVLSTITTAMPVIFSPVCLTVNTITQKRLIESLGNFINRLDIIKGRID